MNDAPLLRQLVDADLGTPVPPGAPITPAGLFARRRRLLLRRLAICVCGISAAAPVIWWHATAAMAADATTTSGVAAAATPRELAVLAARLDQLLADPIPPPAVDPAPRRDAGRRLRLELAMARAAALPDRPPTYAEEHR